MTKLRYEYLLRSGRIIVLPKPIWRHLEKARRRVVVR